jgi:hypothetical protein
MGAMTGRHPLHQQNGNDQAAIASAILILAFEQIDQEPSWRRGDTPANDCVAVPSLTWGEVTNAAGRLILTHGHDPVVRAFAEAVRAVPLKDLYHVRTQEVWLPVQLWADLLTAYEAAARLPDVVKAVATERYIRTGQFTR